MSTQREILENLFRTPAANGLSELDRLCMHGLISPVFIRNLKIVKRVEALVKEGKTKTNAVFEVSDEFKVCESIVYKAMKSLKE